MTRAIKLLFPRLDGVDPAGWVYQAKQFFSYHQTLPNQHVSIASFHLEGKALQWFRWSEHSGVIDGWEDFVKALNIRFEPSGFDDPTSRLTKLWQTTCVQEYQE